MKYNCGFLDPSTQQCQILGMHVPDPGSCHCPHYRKDLIKCTNCGRILLTSPVYDGEDTFCAECAKLSGTCGLCRNLTTCAYESDPSPLPKVVQRREERDGMVFITTGRNPEREQALCTTCNCWLPDLGCCRQYATCGNYERR